MGCLPILLPLQGMAEMSKSELATSLAAILVWLSLAACMLAIVTALIEGSG